MGLSRCPGVCVSGWFHLCLSEFPAEQQEEPLGTPPSPTAVAGTMLSSAPAEPGKLLHHCLSVEGFLVSGAALPPAPEGL